MTKERAIKQVFRLRPELDQALGLVQAVRSGNLLFVGGLSAVDEEGQVIAADSIESQLDIVYTMLGKVLQAHGAGPEYVLKETLLATDAPALWSCLPIRQVFYAAGDPPALTTAEVRRFVLPGVAVMLDAVVALPG